MKPLIVQKYGGSVLRGTGDFLRAAGEVSRAVEAEYRVLAVVSAPGGTTDRLCDEARGLHPTPDPRALDLFLATGELKSVALLAMALARRGTAASFLNPWQLGLHTDTRHGRAGITRINPLLLRLRCAESDAVIVPGFLGRGEEGCLTTLGRGGSDLTALALAEALSAETCEFFKDVPGYFSTDPRLVPEALHRPEVTREEALELSRFGCRFLQDRAIEWAVSGRSRVRLRALEETGRYTELSRRAARPPPPRLTAMTHCKETDAPAGAGGRGLPAGAALVSLVGEGLRRLPGLEEKVLRTLAAEGIAARPAGGSERRITVAVQEEALAPALRRLHAELFPAEETPEPGKKEHRNPL